MMRFASIKRHSDEKSSISEEKDGMGVPKNEGVRSASGDVKVSVLDDCFAGGLGGVSAALGSATRSDLEFSSDGSPTRVGIISD